MSTTWPEEKHATTVGSRLSPTMNAHHGPAQQTSITLSMYCNCRISGKTDHGKLRLRHARDVYDHDMHNNGHVSPVHNAQFQTVHTRLCRGTEESLHHHEVDELDLRHLSAPRADATGDGQCPGSAKTNNAQCPDAPTHARCRRPSQCTHPGSKQTARSHLMSAQRGWIKVRTQFRPRVRTYLRTFLNSGKVR